MQKNGLVVSEYPKEEKARSEYFLKRNRIVSGLSIGIFIVEAKYRSGTSVTAKLAKQQGKEIYCIPHAINDRNGIGTNRLIKNGAKLVTETREIIEEFPFLKYDETKIRNFEIKKPKLETKYQQVFNNIGNIPIGIEELCYKTKKDISEITEILLTLELKGYIRKVGGGYKCILNK